MFRPRTKNKFNAVGRWYNGEYYPSGAELEYAKVLEIQQKTGKVKSFIHHPPAVKLYGNVTWQVDFSVTNPGGQEFYVEVKGKELEGYKLKLEYWRTHIDLPLYVVKQRKQMQFDVIEKINTEGIERLA